jgi:hypothetical protein
MQANPEKRLDYLTCTLVVGVGATAVMDLWGIARSPLLGFAPPDYGLVGRWLIGWTAHYLIGIAFAALLLAVWGSAWIARPDIGPALIVGVGSVAAPFLLMQPGMGMGIAGSRTTRPTVARLQSFLTHAIFGIGLSVAGWAARWLFGP